MRNLKLELKVMGIPKSVTGSGGVTVNGEEQVRRGRPLIFFGGAWVPHLYRLHFTIPNNLLFQIKREETYLGMRKTILCAMILRPNSPTT